MQKKKKRNDHSKPGLYLKYSALSVCDHHFLLISPNSLTITINLFLSGLIPQKPFITLFFWKLPACFAENTFKGSIHIFCLFKLFQKLLEKTTSSHSMHGPSLEFFMTLPSVKNSVHAYCV